MAPVGQFVSTTIRAGQALSDALDVGTGTPTLLFLPDQINGGRMSFQIGDGEKFYDVFGGDGREIVKEISGGAVLPLEAEWVANVVHFRLRTGTRAQPTRQEADRLIRIYVVT